MALRNSVLKLTTLVLLTVLPELGGSAAEPRLTGFNDQYLQPFQPDYTISADGAVQLRICFNWSCNRPQQLRFTADEMAQVIAQMEQCSGTSQHDRLQRIRIGIWQMEMLAKKHQPLLANDRGGNELDSELAGRTDCIDNTSNTRTFLRILQDLAALPGWSVAEPRSRNRLPLDNVHWTAVVKDEQSGDYWTVDSWYRPHGHLPFVLPLADWLDEKKGWEDPFTALNPYPRWINELCDSSP